MSKLHVLRRFKILINCNQAPAWNSYFKSLILTNISLASRIAALASRNTTTHDRSIWLLSSLGSWVGVRNRSRLRDTFELPQGDSQISSSLVGLGDAFVTKSDKTTRKSAANKLKNCFIVNNWNLLKNNLLFKVKFGLTTGMFITLWVLENFRDKMAKKSYYVLIKMGVFFQESW